MNPPKKVVAVAPAGLRGGYPYLVATLYELGHKKNGDLVYRRSDRRIAWGHRSKRLAEQDAQAYATEHKLPYWPDTRHWDTPEQAFEKSPEEKARIARLLQENKS